MRIRRRTKAVQLQAARTALAAAEADQDAVAEVRLKAVLSMLAGERKRAEIAADLKVREEAVSRWTTWFLRGGVPRLLRHHRGARKRPDGRQWERLVGLLQVMRGEPEDEVLSAVGEQLGRPISRATLYRWRREMPLTPGVPVGGPAACEDF